MWTVRLRVSSRDSPCLNLGRRSLRAGGGPILSPFRHPAAEITLEHPSVINSITGEHCPQHVSSTEFVDRTGEGIAINYDQIGVVPGFQRPDIVPLQQSCCIS